MRKFIILAVILAVAAIAAAHTDEITGWAENMTADEPAVEACIDEAAGSDTAFAEWAAPAEEYAAPADRAASGNTLPVIHEEYCEEEETAPKPMSGNCPHITITRHENGSTSVGADFDWQHDYDETEKSWKAMHELMPDYCKPYLEDTPIVGARNVMENEMGIYFSCLFGGTIGYRHYYNTETLLPYLEDNPAVYAGPDGSILMKYKRDNGFINILNYGTTQIYLYGQRDCRVLDVKKLDERIMVLYADCYTVKILYVYPNGLNGKNAGYLYQRPVALQKLPGKKDKDEFDALQGKILTDNIYRLVYEDGRIQHWKVKLDEGEIQDYNPTMFPSEQYSPGIWRYLVENKKLLWTNREDDPALNGYAYFSTPETDSRSRDFNSNTSKEPVY